VVHLLKENGATLLTNAKIIEISKEGVLYEHDEEAHLSKADQVIIAMGANPNLELTNALKDKNIAVIPIGDCTSVGYIHGAIADARNAVLAMDNLT
jgi:thioredoxin reductase